MKPTRSARSLSSSVGVGFSALVGAPGAGLETGAGAAAALFGARCRVFGMTLSQV